MFELDRIHIAIVGLGYVGLPLAVELGRHFPTTGFDVDPTRVAELQQGKDRSLETEASELEAATRLRLTDDAAHLGDCNFYIVTVPTPIDAGNHPDLTALLAATRNVAGHIKPGDIVVYESTVYPGATEEDCVPILESGSGLVCNRDFFVGYSPERINPGDRNHRLPDIVKVTSGSTPEAAEFIDRVYGTIIRAGTFRAASIRTAEAAKIIENVQRDVNIALVNELAMLFDLMGLDTEQVLEAAATKWNFLRFQPGLVGGHCIGVDPYYLTHKALQLGHSPDVILAGRQTNSGMGAFVASKVVKLLAARELPVSGARVLVLGLTFKENCPDLRNTRVVDVIRELEAFGARVDVFDPWADPAEAQREYGIELLAEIGEGDYEAVVLAVAHRQFREMAPEQIRRYGREGAVLYDVKSVLPRSVADGRL